MKRYSFAAAAWTTAILFVVPVAGQAIYTTTANGTTVNGNVYDDRADVFLSGGPNNCNGPGLPDGTYYFQVTDPSASVLLSSDGLAERTVTASNGVIAGYAGTHTTTTFQKCPLPIPANLFVQLIPYDFTPNLGGEYKVSLFDASCSTADAGTGLLNGTPGCFTKTDNFKVKEQGCEGQCDPPPDLGEITGLKWYDVNTNGIFDGGEAPIPGWKVENSDFTTAYTDASGIYHFLGLANTEYTITEIFPNATWLATTPTSGTITTDGLGNAEGPDFGNVCLGAGGGMTLGFWSNKNGAKIFDSNGSLAVVNALNLVNGSGAPSNFANHAAFKSWILSANATNMAYMLSAQLAAMALNVHSGKVDGNALIYAPGTASANAAGFATVNAIIAEADAQLLADPITFSGDPNRTIQEALKNALDAGNNNTNFVQPAPCPFTTPY